MTTYKEIKNFILEKHGKKIKSSWIAHAKEVFGVTVKRAANAVFAKLLQRSIVGNTFSG